MKIYYTLQLGFLFGRLGARLKFSNTHKLIN